ncbi:hypothetical protein PPO43_06530 [Saprospira sp. CCB-QB6]|uniref:hypothetical protein n=1 Tax=Saprospira sp. CCB-QB6 TaxID=3023936 RepID=UPI002349DA0F|nr:hypothetical protein [Saprospira sp. CCB-QB6]WCL82746.1 hypothetical protein PPO43_06530 [Saprospira sp. CCB-QB6]
MKQHIFFLKKVPYWQEVIIQEIGTTKEQIAQFSNAFLEILASSQAGLCHTNSALLYCFLQKYRVPCKWRVGFFETFEGFPKSCKVWSHQTNTNISWHSWLEIDKQILDLTIINQKFHYGFPPIVFDNIISSELVLNEQREIVSPNGEIIAKYHYKCPPQHLSDKSKSTPSLIKNQLSPIVQLKTAMGDKWEIDFNSFIKRRLDVDLEEGWSEKFNSYVCE